MTSPILKALEIARWAPSGDNSQPWRFKMLDDFSVRIRTKRSPENPYEFRDGFAVLLSLGGLLENLRLAALADGYALHWQYDGMENSHWIVTARLTETTAKTDPLLAHIATRSVNRMPMRTTALTAEEKQQLSASLGDNLTITWFENFKERLSYSVLNAHATNVRLRLPEAFPVHQNVFAWTGLTSEDKLPMQTLPLSALSRPLMRWVLAKWSRARFMNRYCFGTLAPIIETDLVPGLKCAAHFAIAAKNFPTTPQAVIESGIATQRFWLTLTALGLTMQPNFSALAFGYYGNHNIPFTSEAPMAVKAFGLGQRLKTLLASKQVEADAVVFAGRIGHAYPRKIVSRSIRLPLQKLIEN